jgi:hypothetical protein
MWERGVFLDSDCVEVSSAALAERNSFIVVPLQQRGGCNRFVARGAGNQTHGLIPFQHVCQTAQDVSATATRSPEHQQAQPQPGFLGCETSVAAIVR